MSRTKCVPAELPSVFWPRVDPLVLAFGVSEFALGRHLLLSDVQQLPGLARIAVVHCLMAAYLPTLNPVFRADDSPETVVISRCHALTGLVGGFIACSTSLFQPAHRQGTARVALIRTAIGGLRFVAKA